MKSDITKEYLEECFDLCHETGVLTWKSRPTSHFKTEKGQKIFNVKFAGKQVKAKTTNGYITIAFRSISKQSFYGHRVVWLMTYGEWPARMIDHINGIKTDNRIGNLREVTRGQNNMNAKKGGRRTSSYKGVHFDKARSTTSKPWAASIGCGGKVRHLGRFSTEEEAHQRYCDAAKDMFGEFFNDGRLHTTIPMLARFKQGIPTP